MKARIIIIHYFSCALSTDVVFYLCLFASVTITAKLVFSRHSSPTMIVSFWLIKVLFLKYDTSFFVCTTQEQKNDFLLPFQVVSSQIDSVLYVYQKPPDRTHLGGNSTSRTKTELEVLKKSLFHIACAEYQLSCTVKRNGDIKHSFKTVFFPMASPLHFPAITAIVCEKIDLFSFSVFFQGPRRIQFRHLRLYKLPALVSQSCCGCGWTLFYCFPLL